MPTTYNGIGTHYYGKRNRSSRTAACRSCRRVGVLDSYDTRLWFVIAFIPVIPLGRKRIMDACPACTRHFAADAAQYEQAKQLQTSGSLDRFRRDPSPQVAQEIHAGLLAFHEHDRAAEFRATALEQFPDHAGLRAGLAAQLDEVLEYNQGAALFEEALALDPDLPEARAGVALRRINTGALDEARDLLDYLEAPGAGQVYRLGPLESLAYAYQANGQHEEALELAACLQRELPTVGQMHAFRKFVGKSERALRQPDSILPPPERSIGGLFRKSGSPYAPWVRPAVITGLVATLLVAGLGLNNWWIKTHRQIRLVNATDAPVRVAVDDGPAIEFGAEGNLTVPEGHHRLVVSGPVTETHEVDIQADFFDRWSNQPLWVLNPGGEAAFDQMTVVYAEQPAPPSHDLIVGRPFIALPHIDYAFTDPPRSMSVKKGSSLVTKTVFHRVPLADEQGFLHRLDVDRAGALDAAERQLRRHPDNLALLEAYVRSLPTTDPARAEAFLRTGLDRRPVAIAWHRAFQNAAGMAQPGSEGKLVAQYDGLLAQAPGDAALLYLRGRIDPDDARAADFYRRSIEADPKLGWPWLALGIHAGARAEWPEAIRCLRQAKQLGLDPDIIAEPLHTARLAAGEAPALVEEYRQARQAQPDDLGTLVFLAEALAASEQGDAIEGEIQSGLLRVPEEVRPQLGPLLRPVGLYIAGKLDEAVASARPSRGRGSDSILAQSLLGLGRVGEVATDSGFESLGDDPLNALAVSLGLALEGRAAEADRWRERAAARFGALPGDYRQLATALRAAEPPPVADLGPRTVDPAIKALAFAVLAARFPDRAADYRAEAARFNIRRKPPYALLQRVLGAPDRPAP